MINIYDKVIENEEFQNILSKDPYKGVMFDSCMLKNIAVETVLSIPYLSFVGCVIQDFLLAAPGGCPALDIRMIQCRVSNSTFNEEVSLILNSCSFSDTSFFKSSFVRWDNNAIVDCYFSPSFFHNYATNTRSICSIGGMGRQGRTIYYLPKEGYLLCGCWTDKVKREGQYPSLEVFEQALAEAASTDYHFPEDTLSYTYALEFLKNYKTLVGETKDE